MKAKNAPQPATPVCSSVLTPLGIIGLETVEPILLAALISTEPLLLIGPHGTGKSYLLNRLAQALGLSWRHYNASLLNFDDLVGYPLPDASGGLRYVQTPSSIWGAQAVFLDEISRCRPDMQNKLFPIIHERRVQGLLLESLVYRWSAMNPPARDDDPAGCGYRGSEPLDVALADRFAFLVEMPSWDGLSEQQQEQIILCTDCPVPPSAARRLRGLIDHGTALVPLIHRELDAYLAVYVRLLLALLRQADIILSPRRGGMLLRNIVTVHAARLAADPEAGASESALLALTHSLPQRALEGPPPDRVKLLAAHRQAWQTARLDADDPRRFLLLEPDPLRRALRACRVPSLSAVDFSGMVADALASLPPGGRHALAVELFQGEAAGRLVAAVAEQCAMLSALAIAPQNLQEVVAANSCRHRVWQHVVRTLARLKESENDTLLATNLLTALFAQGELSTEAEVDRVLASWQQTRLRVREVLP